MSLLRHGCQRHSVLNSQIGSQMYTSADQMNWQFVQILMYFQIRVKTSCTGHRWCKAKDFFVFCSGKICLVCFHGLFFCFICHLCLLHKINAQTPITANLYTYKIHEFLVNVKCRMDGSHRKPYISACRLISWYNILPMEHAVCRNMSPPSGFFERVTFDFSLYWNSLTWLTGND